MFTTLYFSFFIFFLIIGFFIGKKYQEYFYSPLNSTTKIQKDDFLNNISNSLKKIPIDLSSQYDILSRVEEPFTYIGLKENKIDLIIAKQDENLNDIEDQITNIVNNNNIFLRVIVLE